MKWFTKKILGSELIEGEEEKERKENPRNTPSRFTSAKHYLAYFLPMFMREVVAEIGSEAGEKVRRMRGAERRALLYILY